MTKILSTLVLGCLSGGALFMFLQGAFSAADTRLKQHIEVLEQELSAKDLQLSFLRERKRIARLEVVEQRQDASRPGGLVTRFRFLEEDPAGRAYNEGNWYEIDGDVVYVDALLIKFDDQFVEQNDLLRGSSLLLFRRLFGEYQNPADGFVLDSVGKSPSAYAAEASLPAFQRDLWQHFWDYALNPAVARASGVRAMHGEAPFIKLSPGKSYAMELRTSGGLTIRTLDP